jgi:hypothetical protein
MLKNFPLKLVFEKLDKLSKCKEFQSIENDRFILCRLFAVDYKVFECWDNAPVVKLLKDLGLFEYLMVKEDPSTKKKYRTIKDEKEEELERKWKLFADRVGKWSDEEKYKGVFSEKLSFRMVIKEEDGVEKCAKVSIVNNQQKNRFYLDFGPDMTFESLPSIIQDQFSEI